MRILNEFLGFEQIPKKDQEGFLHRPEKILLEAGTPIARFANTINYSDWWLHYMRRGHDLGVPAALHEASHFPGGIEEFIRDRYAIMYNSDRLLRGDHPQHSKRAPHPSIIVNALGLPQMIKAVLLKPVYAFHGRCSRTLKAFDYGIQELVWFHGGGWQLYIPHLQNNHIRVVQVKILTG